MNEFKNKSSKTSFPLACIGASAGGLEAITELLRHLPVDTGMAFVCIEHLDPTYHSMLTEILTKTTRIQVSQVENGMRVEPNHVYVIPPNASMIISENVLKLVPRSPNPIDYFLYSLAKDRGTSAIGIVLSGTGSDGSEGIRAIKTAGGITFAQQEKSAKFDQMPHHAIATGCVDFVLAPKDIALTLGSFSVETDEAFHQIVLLLKQTSGVDFSSYKPTTLKRRITRRMVLSHQESFPAYFEFLKKNPEELAALHQDVLIKVTSFFRDPEIFKVLQRDIFPSIIKNKCKGTPLRIWVPACSTGEEVYSLAITLLEHLGDKANDFPIQFFGSDIKDSCIETARAGIYPESISKDVSAKRLKLFFNQVDQGYQITKLIRERCIFAKQNVAADPPFSKIDLISCRNLLIYFAPALQKKVILTFHYALNPEGLLLLGPSESVSDCADLFETVNQKARIYFRKHMKSNRSLAHLTSNYIPEKLLAVRTTEKNEDPVFPLDVHREADRVVLAKYGPAGVVINEALEILQFRGDTSHYLRQAPGKPSLNLLTMAREGLKIKLKNALNKVIAGKNYLKIENIQIKDNAHFKNVSIEITPLRVLPAEQKHFLILFTAGVQTPEVLPVKSEFVDNKAYLQSIIEEKETTNWELQVANDKIITSNEELQSLNEEMQSANEELQTAKEELQASNEELTTVNEELNNRNMQLSRLNDDFWNVTRSLQLPIVIVGNDSKIRFFTPSTERIFNLVATDIGRSIHDIKLKVKIVNLDGFILHVTRDLATLEHEIQDEKGHWYNLKMQPYLTGDNKIDGVIMTFVNIDTLKRNQSLTREYGEYLESLVKTVPVPLLVLDQDLKVKMANEAFCSTFSVASKPWDTDEIRKFLKNVLATGSKLATHEVEQELESIGKKILLLRASQVHSMQVLLLSIEDITEAKQRESQLRELNDVLKERSVKLEKSNLELENFALLASHDLQEPLNIISIFMNLLSSSSQDKLEPQTQEFIKIVLDASNRAKDLISSLLDYAKLDSQKGDLKPIDITTIVEQLVSDFRVTEKCSLEIVCDPLPKIMGDSIQLTRLFQNLISNAVRYRSERPLKIHLSVQKKSKEWIFQIEDNGQGFDPKERVHIFDMFKKLSNQKTSGTGIGLAICKKIVELHGGTIWAESKPGHGSSFHFSIPQ